jgi:hypothetical protein
MPRPCKPSSPFRYFNSSPEVIRLAVLTYVKYPLSLCRATVAIVPSLKRRCQFKPFAHHATSWTAGLTL